MPLTSEQAKLNRAQGGGRQKGQLAPETKLKMRTEKMLKQRIYRMTNKLMNAQAIAALGTHRMVVVETDEQGIKHLRTIRDEDRMDALLNDGKYGEDYIVLAGKEPDWKAANALLDRAYGKAKENLKLEGEVVFSLKALAEKRKLLREQQDQDLLSGPTQ